MDDKINLAEKCALTLGPDEIDDAPAAHLGFALQHNGDRVSNFQGCLDTPLHPQDSKGL
jgi:hypothetical protein